MPDQDRYMLHRIGPAKNNPATFQKDEDPRHAARLKGDGRYPVTTELDRMDVLHLQNLGGLEDLEIVRHYAQMVDEDLLQSHKAHSTIDDL